MKASKTWYQIADMGLYLSILVGVGASITLRRWPINTLLWNILDVLMVLVIAGLVGASIWYRHWCRTYWLKHP
jgi:hypothetical protein